MAPAAGRARLPGARLNPPATLAANLAASPGWLPHSLDVAGDRCLFLALTEAEYRAASFLDGRIVTPQSRGQWTAMDRAIEAARALPVTYRAIFHIGHVGSTLLSRLLGEVPGVFALREPAALRTLAEEGERGTRWWSSTMLVERGRALDALWSRTWRRGDIAIVKATSFASERAAAYLARADAPPAIFMTVRPEPYLATILAQRGNRAEAVALAPARLRRFHRRLGGAAFALWEMGEGARVAMAWAAEMATLAEAAAVAPERVQWLDFEAFLREPARVLALAAAHLGVALASADAAALARGPLLARYAKGPEHAYSPALRDEVLAAARTDHAGEIAAGLRWLDRAAAAHPIVAAALTVAAERLGSGG